jgi:predicted MFS family arabinose efflux permease
MTKENRGNFLKPTLLATAALLVSTGIRNTTGLFVTPIVKGAVMSLTDVSMAMAIGQFAFGLFQPLGGILTARYKTFTILLTGAACLIAGLLGIKFANSLVVLILCFGLLTPAGAAASSFPILIGRISGTIPDDKRSIASGLINAGGSAGQFILAPLIQICIYNYGYYGACVFLACMTALSIIPSWFLCRASGEAPQGIPLAARQSLKKGGLKTATAAAFRNPTYIILHGGFFACGFHVAFLATHFPGEIGLFGYGGSFTALCFSILGICNIMGCILVGILGNYFKSKNLLTGLYLIRTALIILYLIAPKTVYTFIVFAAIAGFTFGATVPPTGDIAALFVQPEYLSALFGLIFVTHQTGSFFGAWLGGVVMDHTGSFLPLWILDAGLSVLAAILSFQIVESRKRLIAG